MENRETPAPMPATDMTVKLFRAMSKANRYQRQTDGSRIANEGDRQKWWRLAGIVRFVSP